MFVGIARIQLHLPESRSLKDKRSIVRAIKDRVRSRTRAAIAEVDHQDLWQRAALGASVVSGEHREAQRMLQSIRTIVDSAPGAELLDWEEEVL